MKKHYVLLKLGEQAHIVTMPEVVKAVIAMRKYADKPKICNNKTTAIAAINLLRETRTQNNKIGFARKLFGGISGEAEPTHISLLSEALRVKPMFLHEFDNMYLDSSYCYKQINKEGKVCGIIGEFNITQTRDYIPVVIVDDYDFKIAFEGTNGFGLDGFMHVSELAKAAVFKLELEKVKAMDEEVKQMDEEKLSTEPAITFGYNKLIKEVIK